MSDEVAEMSLNMRLANAVSAVSAAQDYLRRMEELTSHARHNETDARNRVNKEQKAFDELVALVKKTAPRDTEWKRPIGLPA